MPAYEHNLMTKPPLLEHSMVMMLSLFADNSDFRSVSDTHKRD